MSQSSGCSAADTAVAVAGSAASADAAVAARERLRREKEVLGFYFSDHPLAAYRAQIAARANADTGEAARAGGRRRGDACWLVGGVKSHTDRNKRPMAIVMLEDLTGRVEATVFPDLYERSRARASDGSGRGGARQGRKREDAVPSCS